MATVSEYTDAQSFTGCVETTEDALRIAQAARLGKVPRVTRRLNDLERRSMIKSGAVFVFDVKESSIRRWTEGMIWSPSRIVGNYLVYHEIIARANSRANQRRRSHRHGDVAPSSADNPDTFCIVPFDAANSEQKDAPKPGGLWKRTITVTFADQSEVHVIAYYDPEDIIHDRLHSLSSRPDVMDVKIYPHMFDLSKLRVQPDTVLWTDGREMFSSELPAHRANMNHTSSLLSSHGLIPVGNSQKLGKPGSDTLKARNQAQVHRRQSQLPLQLHYSSRSSSSSPVPGRTSITGRKPSARVSPAPQPSPLGSLSYPEMPRSISRAQKPLALSGQAIHRFYPPISSLPLTIPSHEGLWQSNPTAMHGYSSVDASSFNSNITSEYHRTSESWPSLVDTTTWQFSNSGSSTGSESSSGSYDICFPSRTGEVLTHEGRKRDGQNEQMDYNACFQAPSVLVTNQIIDDATIQHQSSHDTAFGEPRNMYTAVFPLDDTNVFNHPTG